MSDADRLAFTASFEAMIERIVRRVLAEQHPTSPAAVEGFIGCGEAARRAGVKAATVRAWIRADLLPAVKRDGVRGFKIRPADLDAFLLRAPQAGAEPHDSTPVDLAGERARRLAASIPRRGG